MAKYRVEEIGGSFQVTDGPIIIAYRPTKVDALNLISKLEGKMALSSDLINEINTEWRKALRKFPENRNLTVALMEEVGELARAELHKQPEEIKKEAVQVIVVALRIYTEGDGSIEDRKSTEGKY